jgi:hypothetical protein
VAFMTAAHAPGGRRHGSILREKQRSSSCPAGRGWGRTGSPGVSESRGRRSTRCRAGLTYHGFATWTVPRDRPVRYERERPGELIHIDVKKQGRIPDGGGWRAHGRQAARNNKFHDTQRGTSGSDFIHIAVDDHSRVVFV